MNKDTKVTVHFAVSHYLTLTITPNPNPIPIKREMAKYETAKWEDTGHKNLVC